jgi:hypothetical protein
MYSVFVPRKIVVEKAKINAPIVATITRNVPDIEVEIVKIHKGNNHNKKRWGLF